METYLQEIITTLQTVTTDVKEDFLLRLQKGKLLRDNDPVSHFCVYFVPFIPNEKKVFLGHHRKANAWIAPGGHIEHNHETPEETVIQEAHEELGVVLANAQISNPFFLSAFDVYSPLRTCRRHYSIWYSVAFRKEEVFTIEEREFYQAKWMTFDEAHKHITNTENHEALRVLEALQ